MVTIIAEMLNPASYSFSLFSVPPLITATAIFLLGLIVLIRERGSAASVSFLVLTIAVAVWLFTIAWGYSATSEQVAFYWEKALYLAVPFIAPAVYHFSVIILGTYPWRVRLVWLNWLIGAAFSIVIVGTPVVFDQMYHYWFGYYVKFRWPSVLYLVVFVVTILLSLREYWIAYRRAVPGTTYQRRAQSFMIALAAGSLGAVDYLPAYGIAVYPFGYLFIALYVFLVARTIWRYQLVDITPALASRQIIETMTDALIVFDQERIVRLVNPAACALLGLPEDQLIGRPADLIPGGALIASHVGPALDGQRIRNVEVHLDLRDLSRSPLTLSLSASVIRDRRERPTAVVCVARNVTERVFQDEQIRRQAEELQIAYDILQRTQEQIVQQERLYALGTMASGIAHDFNNALTPILGYSQILLSQPDLLENRARTTEWLQLINLGAADAAKVLSRLREFYRPAQTVDEHVAIDLNELIERTVALTRPRWHDQALLSGRVIEIEQELSPVQPVAGAASELREVVTNLIFNAVDALPEGGKIILRTYASGEQIVLEVTDTGTGMSEEVRQKCFEPFYTTKGDQGSGLGLSAVYGSIRRHGGLVDLESAIGQGTTFRISLPIYQRGSVAAEPRDGPVRSRRVLLVEDDARVRDVVLRYLLADGNQVEEAIDGTDGLAKFDPDRFDLVITDRGMPGLDGDRLAAAIKGQAPTMPVIMLTGYGDLMNATSERPPGVDQIVSKPVTLQTLRAAFVTLTSNPVTIRDHSAIRT